MSNELVESTRGKGELFRLRWTFVIGFITYIILSSTFNDKTLYAKSLYILRFWMFFLLLAYILVWGVVQTSLVQRGFKFNSIINLHVQRIEYLVSSQGFNTAKIEVISKDIGSDHRPIWGQRELGNRLIAKRGIWKLKYQKTKQRERQR